ncbi:PPE family protein, SVP subgroup [Mycobacterium sp. Z3061]|uniref:PPE family protein, SVP subgroup n=1 Tax=Mycobacterium sp. Z3061 TaxID=3073562 RepID=UPI0028731066|nr:PE domain-containing protein [Mycobacterium sp. Z3061]
MSFLTAQTEELTAAAGKLQTIGAQQSAQNAAAAVPITSGMIPAAADEVSALQASLFAAYGALYQQVSAEATAMYDTFVNTLGLSAQSYAATESANSAAAALPAALTDSPLADVANIVNIGVGNWASAASNLVGLANGGLLLPVEEGAVEGAADVAGLEGAAAVGAGEAPVAAGLARSPIAAMSAPPAWAGPASLVSSASPRPSAWAAAPPPAAADTTLLPGMPGMASTGRSSSGFGAPRYGVKPIVMARPASI